MPKVFIAGPVSWNRLVRVDRLPDPRPHTVFARGHRETVGGTSAGKALNLARLGAEVTLRTVVGDDAPGRAVLEVLRAAGVEVIAETAAGATEQHLNLMDPHGGRLSVYLELPELDHPAHDDRARAALAEADAAVVDLADHARPFLDADVPIWCDLHDYDGRSAFHRDFADAADHLFLNDDAMPDPEPFLVSRVRDGARTAVATLGARGAVGADASGVHRVDAVPVAEIVDTNGAGDAFFAGFLMAHLAGGDLPAALAAGAAQAVRCLTSPDLA
ncbi:carbohydrate kinase family protein [Actinokineospora soli]|uniref:Carbohydrate kinase family protein n=1 Tax=Actinokineospora soli TaxID=1048753 RepID=A0ABW2TLC3_9PSEU